MRFFARPLGMFSTFLHLWKCKDKAENLKEWICERAKISRRKLKKVPFYSQIHTPQIRSYQSYINRAFLLSESLEFGRNDARFEQLLKEAETYDSLNKIDLELMRLQYVGANKELRDSYRANWAVTVVNCKDDDFFPAPWTIISTLFQSRRLAGKSFSYFIGKLG